MNEHCQILETMDSESPYQPPATYDLPPDQPRHSNTGLTVKKILFSFEGRIPRRTFWLWLLVTLAAFLIPVGLLVPLLERGGTAQGICIVALMPLLVVMIWASLAIRVKRWHDHGKSGAWVFIGMIPYVGGLISLIFLGCMRGTDGPNLYGDDPT